MMHIIRANKPSLFFFRNLCIVFNEKTFKEVTMRTMEEYIYDKCERVDNRTFAQKVKEWFALKKLALKMWFEAHPRETFALVAVMASGAVKIIPKLLRARNISEQERIKEEYVYDRSLGHYWKLRRPLDNDEWREIEERKRSGEKLGDILEQLKVLA